MKMCLQCEYENDDNAFSCHRCRQTNFASSQPSSQQNKPTPTKAPQSPEALTSERDGRLTVLKCRTPGEAFLVVEELEAADILVALPDDDVMAAEYEAKGFVSIRVSAQSYEAAKELQTVIEQQHWDERAKEHLSLPMVGFGVGLGLFPVFGLFVYEPLCKNYSTKKYDRKARTFRRSFYFGIIMFALTVLAAIFYTGRASP
jgi:hypothetical protein